MAIDSPVGLCALLPVPCTLLYCIIPLTFERVDTTDYCLGLEILKLPTVILSVVLHNEALLTLATAACVCCSTLSVCACESDDNLLCARNVVNSNWCSLFYDKLFHLSGLLFQLFSQRCHCFFSGLACCLQVCLEPLKCSFPLISTLLCTDNSFFALQQSLPKLLHFRHKFSTRLICQLPLGA